MSLDREIIEEINDGRVYLEKISENDTPFLYNSLKNEEIVKYMSLNPLPSLNHAKKLIKRHKMYWEKYEQFNYIIKLKDRTTFRPIGSTSVWNIDWGNNRAEIGIWIIPSLWGEGFGTRAIKLVKIISFMHLKLNRLEAHIVTINKRSLQLFLKGGFKKEGLLKEYLNLDGVYFDVFLFAFLNSEF
ncbi:MAG: N-acetyltransferase [Promethearchaeota archaeon]|nr:MAG: N-acetyltransferase [Candidatus Lokiarchaeota archaeon]